MAFVSRDEFYDEITRLRRELAITASEGLEVRSTPFGTALGLTQSSIRRTANSGPVSLPCFYARLTGCSQAGANRWSYTFVEVSNAGAGAWGAAGENARVGVAYNMCESMNSPTGVQGNGIDQDNLTANFPNFAIMPIHADPNNGCVVVMWLVGSHMETNTEVMDYAFAQVNAVDGTCSSGQV